MNPSSEQQQLVLNDSRPTSGHQGIDNKLVTGRRAFNLAATYYLEKKFSLAAEAYVHTARSLIGHDLPFLGLADVGVEVESYRALDRECCILLMDCCQGISNCNSLLSSGSDLALSLDWLYEMQIIAKNLRYQEEAPDERYEWEHCQGLADPLITTKLIACLARQAMLFRVLGNTSSYQYCVVLAEHYLSSLRTNISNEDPLSLSIPTLASLIRHQKEGFNNLRHPDPFCDQRYKIVSPSLQVRGAWKKLCMEVDESMARARTFGTAFIWNGHLYTVGGKSKDGGQKFILPDDIRRINLSRLDKWEIVAKIPAPHFRGHVANVRVLSELPVYKAKLYIFWGNPVIDVLDLKTNKWSTLKTTFKPTTADRRLGIDPIWPWQKQVIMYPSQQIANGRLYVFGGKTMVNTTGSNLLMELNLKTLKWRRLSGLPWLTATPDPHEPGPRRHAASWMSKDKKKIYIFSGDCDEQRTMGEMRYGPPKPWMYNDMWSWDIEKGSWREERMSGNPPAPRSSMGYVFSQKLNKAIIFGGANYMCPTIIEGSRLLSSAMYADTFMWSPGDPISGELALSARSGTTPINPQKAHWQQIQTCGFPTYRWDHSLVEDPDTGHIYLYGGEVRGDTLPTKNHTEAERKNRATYESTVAEGFAAAPEFVEAMGLPQVGIKSLTRYFNEIWQLHIDVPGGGFEAVNMEDELRTAALGPWQRCFVCRKVGFWKKCGGSCNGTAFFCSQDCQTVGWKEHKQFHDCKKLAKSEALVKT